MEKVHLLTFINLNQHTPHKPNLILCANVVSFFKYSLTTNELKKKIEIMLIWKWLGWGRMRLGIGIQALHQHKAEEFVLFLKYSLDSAKSTALEVKTKKGKHDV